MLSPVSAPSFEYDAPFDLGTAYNMHEGNLAERKRMFEEVKPSGMIEMDDLFFERVYAEVGKIPPGSVCTYGTIAELAGYPKAAREVGFAMSRASASWGLPFHRVVNKKGTLAPDYAFGGKDKQRRLLEDEGITFIDEDTINMPRYQWPAGPEPEQLTLMY